MKPLFLLALPLALSSCGLIDDLLDARELQGRADELEEIVDLADDIDAVLNGGGSDRIDLLTEAEVAERSGSVTYSGLAGWSVPDGAGSIVMTGEARITADFDDSTVAAELDNWLGVRLDANDEVVGFGDYDATGDIAFSNGTFVENGGDFSFVGDIDGELEWQGDDYGVSGSVEGSIGIVDGTEKVAAANTGDTTFTVNGDEVDGGEFGFGGD